MSKETNSSDLELNKARYFQIIENMEYLNEQRIARLSYAGDERSDYLQLTCALSSVLENLFLKEEKTAFLKGAQTIIDLMLSNQDLLNYDCSYDFFWSGFAPEFVETLDKVNFLISKTTQSVQLRKNKNHVLSAIKYLGSKDLCFEDKLKIYNSIVPYNDEMQSVIDIYLVKN